MYLLVPSSLEIQCKTQFLGIVFTHKYGKWYLKKKLISFIISYLLSYKEIMYKFTHKNIFIHIWIVTSVTIISYNSYVRFDEHFENCFYLIWPIILYKNYTLSMDSRSEKNAKYLNSIFT